MRRWLTRISIAMMALLSANWIYARAIGTNFRNISGHEQFRAISCVIGNTEAAWLVDAGGVTMSFISENAGDALPLVGRHGFAGTLFRELYWQQPTHVRSFGISSAFLTTFDATTSSGAAVTVRLTGVRYWPVFVILSVAPMCSFFAWSRPNVWRRLQYQKSMRLRRRRTALGQCHCGYDLRATRHRCPECGQAIRWLPTPFPSRSTT